MVNKRLGVFCGAAVGKTGIYKEMVQNLGAWMVQNHIDLVYGGASVGLMGVLADAVLEGGGAVYGVIPRFMLEVELAHSQLTELIIVDSMHERKFKMYELSDAFLALPGGLGTLDELCEILTWGQLGRHQKPCGLFDYRQYYSFFLQQLTHMTDEGFLRQGDRERLRVFQSVEEIGKIF